MRRFLRENSLSLVFFILFLITIVGQAVSGLEEHNHEMIDEGGQPIKMGEYISSGHFLQSTFENWESEFLQMALFVILTIFLYQKGSSESKDPEKKEPVDREPNPKKKDAPWAKRDKDTEPVVDIPSEDVASDSPYVVSAKPGKVTFVDVSSIVRTPSPPPLRVTVEVEATPK